MTVRFPILLLLLLGLAGPGTGAPRPHKPGSETVVLPMRPYGTQPAVEVMVNGRGPYLFLVDTGASGVARIDSKVAAELALPDAGETQVGGALGQGQVAIRRVRVDSLRLSQREFRDLTPLSRSYNAANDYVPEIGGILALNLFADQLLTIDFPNNQVVIEDGSLPPADGKEVLDYDPGGDLVHLPITLGVLRLSALLDTGTDRALDLPTAIVRKLPLSSFPHPIGRAEGVTGSVPIAEVAIDGTLTIGKHRFKRPAATYSDSFEGPLIGSALLRDFTITIDQRNKRIRIRRPHMVTITL
jgi:predicted aspartyl protease